MSNNGRGGDIKSGGQGGRGGVDGTRGKQILDFKFVYAKIVVVFAFFIGVRNV